MYTYLYRFREYKEGNEDKEQTIDEPCNNFDANVSGKTNRDETSRN